MALSQSDMYSLALAQGLPPDRAKVAAAIGMGESGGNPNAHNTNTATGDNSYGVWQINMLGRMGPERLKLFGISKNEDLFNPATNAKAMAILSKKGADFNDWSVFRNGTYLKYMGNSVTDNSKKPGWLDTIVGAIPGVGIVDNVADATSGLAGMVDATAKTARWVSDSKNWIRVVYVVGGSALVVGGLVVIISDTRAGKIATKLAAKAATKGKI